MKKTIATIIITAVIAAVITAAAFLLINANARRTEYSCTRCGSHSVIVPDGYSFGTCPDCGAFIEM